MKKPLMDIVNPDTEITLIFNSFTNQYNLAFKLEEGITYISTDVVELGDKLLNVILSGLTENLIYTVGKAGASQNGNRLNVFIDPTGSKIVTEHTFKIDNPNRFKLFKNMTVHTC